ncbi:MAG: transposase [Caldilineaceae bacterium SB0666_bin_21]|nr:transposase [Caldilineaceae bacterium SB0666_bin_21]
MTIDTLGCQTEMARTMAHGGGWYLLAVKDNQSDLHTHLRRDFAYLAAPPV